MVATLWFIGLVGLLVATLFASSRARAAPADVVSRGIVGVAGVAYVGLVVAAVWTWGGAVATSGRATQLRDGALVHLGIEGVRIPLAGTIAIGHAPDAAIRLPGNGGELARIELADNGAVVVRGSVLAAVHGDDGAASAGERGCAPNGAAYALPTGASIAVVECDGARPVRALIVRYAGRGELMIAPLVWRGKFVAEQLTARAGDALRIGGADDVIAGLTTWPVLAPHGAAAMLAIPADPTDCATWQPDAGARARAFESGCLLDVGAFTVAAVPLVPDADGVIDRGLRAAFAIGGPPLVLLVVLALAARRDRRTRALGRALRLCVLGASLTALCSWRLLWAYRIDVLRELASIGPRLVENQLAVIGIGAALAGNAVLAHESLAGASLGRRAFAAVLAWVGWLALAALVVGDAPALTVSRAGALGLSLLAAVAPVACALASRVASRLPPDLGLLAIAGAAVVGRLVAPRSALLKLGLAYALVLAAHAALRRLLVPETSLRGRVTGVVLLGAAALALARYDAGVALAIAGLGLTCAMLVAGHDAAYDASQAARIGVLEREHARLLAAHGAAGIALALGVATCALVASDRELIAGGAAFLVHAPLVVAVLFAMAAIIARSHRRGWAPWLCAALAALAVWGAHDTLVERATAGDNVGARRVAAVLDPGYAVLRDERTFVANASAWREAALPHAAADRWTGEGYFGARVRDLGVSRSIDNDYLPVLVARETGVGGLTQTIALLLAIAVGGGAIASLRLRHASRQHRARWLVTAVVGGLAVYQPLAALGVLPLTGISWPGLGIDSPADIWLFVLGAVWCFMCDDDVNDDERIRRTARLRRARAIVLAALGVAAVAAVIVVARAGGSALGRVAAEDDRIDTALRYAASVACPWPSRTGATFDDVVPTTVSGEPRDDATARFDRELRAAWSRDRTLLLAGLASCRDRAGRWRLTRDGEACVATLHAGMPTIELRLERAAAPSGTSGADPTSKARTLDADATSKVGAPNAESASKAGTRGADSINKAGTPGAESAGKAGTRGTESTSKAGTRGADPTSKAGTASAESADTPGADPTEKRRGTRRDTSGSKPASTADADSGKGGEEEGSARGAAEPDGDGDARDDSEASELTAAGGQLRGSCRVALSESLIAAMRAPVRATQSPRIRVVGEAMGVAAADLGELVAGAQIVRLRAGAPVVELAKLAPGITPASRVAIAGDVALDIRATPRGVMLHGGAELFVAEPGQPPAWRRMTHGPDVLLDRVTLIAAGAAEHRTVALFRPPRDWSGSPPVVDTLLADDTSSVGDRPRRTYPHGAALPELGWVNPFDVDRSLGLDGWIHAALRKPSTAGPACGTLAPPTIARERVCSPSPLDGVMECRVALQPELAAKLRAIAEAIIAEPKPHTGRDVTPVRLAYAVLRGDTGALLAQGNIAPGRAPLAYAPVDAAAEAALIKLRESHGESDAERVEWNLPIAVGSTFKPILARAAEQAFSQVLGTLSLTADGHVSGCKARRGIPVDPMLGHCPPSSLADPPTTADVHDYLARSLNWYQGALGVLGLGLPDGSFSVKGEAVTLADIAASDLSSWPTSAPLQIADAKGPILDGHNLVLSGLRRTPMWSRIEALLGRPLCTLGDRARCAAAAERADLCAARSLPIASPGRDLRYLVALGPDRIDLHGDDRPSQSKIPIREYFQLLRGAGVHAIGSLVQLTDAFGRVVYDPSAGPPRLAASWFPAPIAGVTPGWRCGKTEGHATTVLGADGGLCAVVLSAGTAHAHLGELLGDARIAIYGAKTGTIDSLADVARRAASCQAWNERHPRATQLVCGKTPPDDSLFVIAFGVVTPTGTIPITLGLQLQRGGKGSAAHVTPEFVRAIADYLR